MSFVRAKIILPSTINATEDQQTRRDMNLEQIGVVRSIRASNPFVQPALQAIYRSLLGGGIRITKGESSAMELEADLKDLINMEWSAFCKDLLTDIITYGISIVAIDTDNMKPYTMEPLQWFSRISVVSNEFGLDRFYELTLAEAKQTDGAALLTQRSSSRQPPIFVIEFHRPDASGDLTSPCRTLIPLDGFIHTIMSCQITVNLRNARPPIIVSSKEQKPEEKQTMRDINASGQTALLHRNRSLLEHKHHVEASREQMQALRNINREYEQSDIDYAQSQIEMAGNGGMLGLMHAMPTNGGVAAVNNVPLIRNPATGAAEYPALVGYKQYEGSMIKLPPNSQLETSQPAQGAESFIVKMMEFVRDVTYANIGIPSLLWGSTTSSVAGNIVVLTTYNDTKHDFRVMLQAVLKGIFIYLCGGNELMAEMEQKLKASTAGKKVRVSKSLAESMSFDEAALDDLRSRINVSLPGVLDFEQINTINNWGLLPFESLARYVAAYAGIPREDLATEPMDPATGRPMAEVQKEQMQREDQVMRTQAQLQMSVKAPGKSGAGKAPPQKKPRTNASTGAR